MVINCICVCKHTELGYNPPTLLCIVKQSLNQFSPRKGHGATMRTSTPPSPHQRPNVRMQYVPENKKTEQLIQIHMFTYWHTGNLRGSVHSEIPLGCLSQREPAADRPPEDLSVCLCICSCIVYQNYAGSFSMHKYGWGDQKIWMLVATFFSFLLHSLSMFFSLF